jgi:hypothetical protein
MSDAPDAEPLEDTTQTHEHRLVAEAIGDSPAGTSTPADAAYVNRVTEIAGALATAAADPLPVNWAMRRAQMRRHVAAALPRTGAAATLKRFAVAAAVMVVATMGALQIAQNTTGPIGEWLAVTHRASASPSDLAVIESGREVRVGGSGYVSGDMPGGWRMQAGPTTVVAGRQELARDAVRLELTRGDLIVTRGAGSGSGVLSVSLPSGWSVEFAADATGTAVIRQEGAPYDGEPFVRDNASQTVSGTYADVSVARVAADLRQVLNRPLRVEDGSVAANAVISIRLDRVAADEAFDVVRRCFAEFRIDVHDDGRISADGSGVVGRNPYYGESPAFVQLWDARGVSVRHRDGASPTALDGSTSVLLAMQKKSGPADGYKGTIRDLDWHLAARDPIVLGPSAPQQTDIRVCSGGFAVMRLGDDYALAVRERENNRDASLRYVRVGDPFRDADGNFEGRIDRIASSGFWVESADGTRFYSLSAAAPR